MPAADDFHTKKTHIPDRNSANRVFTLCGRNMEEVFFYEEEANFEQATCFNCRRIYFPVPGDLP